MCIGMVKDSASSPTLNLSEVMAAGRHTSVSASLAYQRRCGHSEARRFDVVENGMERGAEKDVGGDLEAEFDSPKKKLKMVKDEEEEKVVTESTNESIA